MNSVNVPILITFVVLQAVITSGGAVVVLLSQEGVNTVQDVSQAAWIVAGINGILAAATTALAKLQNPGKKNPSLLN